MAIGIVEDNDDPLYKGRVRVRVFGNLDQNENDDLEQDFTIPTDCLPWARPRWTDSGSIRGSGNFSIPKLGSVLNIEYENGDEYAPVYTGYKCVSDEVMSEIQSSYKNAHVLLYDTVFGDTKNGNEYSNGREGEYIKVFFTEEKGLMLDYCTTDGSSSINIKPDNSIEVKSLDKCSIIIDKEGNITINNNGKTEITTKGDTTVNVDGNSTISTKGNTSIQTKGNADIQTNGNINLKTSGTTDIKSSGKTTVDSPNVEITGGKVKIKGNVAPTTGPFCAIPNCLFTGAPHGGDTVSGT